ncbi:MAG: hypothetical protein WBM41_15720 [Arenicellales bacterium]
MPSRSRALTEGYFFRNGINRLGGLDVEISLLVNVFEDSFLTAYFLLSLQRFQHGAVSRCRH